MIGALVPGVLAILLSLPAWGQPARCVDAIAAWTAPYSQGTIQAITYFVWQQPFSATPLMSVLYRSGEFHLHIGVPNSIAQRFTALASADRQYNSTIKNTYHQAVLGEDLCPMLNESGIYLVGEIP